MEKGTFGMDTVITATARANAMDGSVIWLNVGEEMSAYDMIRSVVIAPQTMLVWRYANI